MRAHLPIVLLAVLTLAALAPARAESPAAAASSSAADQWWQNVASLCGKAYAGEVVTEDAADADFAAERLVMHVRRCSESRIEIPFHVGENRSRTWLLTRTAAGIQLEHDHRHEDGSDDAVTLYGGHTADAGTAVAQSFPADERSREMFVANGIPQSVTNVWTMEIVPEERFSYALRRPGRNLQVDFDLSQSIEPPPAPWGHE